MSSSERDILTRVLLTCLSRPEDDNIGKAEAVNYYNDEMLPTVGLSVSPAISSPGHEVEL